MFAPDLLQRSSGRKCDCRTRGLGNPKQFRDTLVLTERDVFTLLDFFKLIIRGNHPIRYIM
uniref:SFRICE_017167 n=1 Tax=Spodoptera frugiperda TaxID=7108 RepID=A0A2H1WDE3_SPOFR